MQTASPNVRPGLNLVDIPPRAALYRYNYCGHGVFIMPLRDHWYEAVLTRKTVFLFWSIDSCELSSLPVMVSVGCDVRARILG